MHAPSPHPNRSSENSCEDVRNAKNAVHSLNSRSRWMAMSESDADSSSLPPPPPPLPHANSPQQPHGSKGKSNPLEGRIQMPVRRSSTNSGRSQGGSVSVPINHPSNNASPVLLTRNNQWSPSSEPSTPPITDTFEPILGARRRRWKCWVITGMTVVALILAAMFGFYLAGQRQIFLRHIHEHHHLHDQVSGSSRC